MAIIYSYPATAPTLDDLLIGTDVGADNATKSFTVQSLVALINAEAGSGTVTDVTISTDAFLRAIKTSQPGVPAITYTLELVDNGTTPNATNFYRGDGKWVVPTVTSGITISYSNVNVTSDLQSMNFTGAGITVGSDANGNVEITVQGATAGVDSIIAGNGISISGATEDVVITNTGITGLVNGGGISISKDSNGLATLSTTGQTQGTVTSVTVGSGLSLLSGTTILNPQIGLDYTGADTYITQPLAAVPLQADFIPFHSVTGTAVKKVTFGDIQASTLALVNTSITAANADAITNTYDKSQQGAAPNDRTIGAPPAVQIVTLSAQEYTDLGNETPSGIVNNFIYLTTAAAVTPNTVNFTVTDSINNAGACAYNIDTTLNGSPFNGSNNSVTGAPGTSYILQSEISGFGSCSFSASTVQTISSTIPNTPSPASVNQSVSGTLTAAAVPGTSTASLSSINYSSFNPGPAATPGDYTVTSVTQSGTDGDSYQGTAFNLSANVSNTAEWNLTLSTSTYSPSSGTFGSTNNVVGSLIGSIVKKSYQVAWNITGGYGSYVLDTDYFLNLTSSIPGASTNTASGNGLIDYNTAGDAASMNVNITTRAGLTFTSGGAMSAQNAVTGAGVTLTIPLTGTVSAGAGTVQMIVGTNSISGGSEGADYTMSYTYQIDSGTVSTYNLGDTPSVNINSNIVFVATATAVSPKTISCGATAVVGTGNFTMPSSGGAQSLTIGLAGAIATNRFPISVANVGGGIPGSSYPACNGSTITGYTNSDLSSTGLSVGDVVYSSICGGGFFKPASSFSYYKASVAPNSSNGYVRFTSGGAVDFTGLC